MENKETIQTRKPIQKIVFLILGFLVWLLLNYNLLKLANYLCFQLLPLKPDTKLGESIVYFVYNLPKVILLLVLVIFIVGILRSFFSPAKTRNFLQGKNEWVGNILASLLGVVTPFCTCSAVPLFIGFVEAGIPLGVTFSFLIAAPMINEVALVMLYFFSWQTSLLYFITGLLIAIFAGIIIGKLGLEKYVEDWVYQMQSKGTDEIPESKTIWNRIDYALSEVHKILAKVWIYIVAGIAAGSLIHGFVPTNYLASVMGKQAWWSVPLAVVIGIPMYSNAAGLIPVIKVLLEKGASLGTALAFMMAVIGLSLPEMIILRKVLKLKLIFIFIGIVGFGILLVGYLFNFLL